MAMTMTKSFYILLNNGCKISIRLENLPSDENEAFNIIMSKAKRQILEVFEEDSLMFSIIAYYEYSVGAGGSYWEAPPTPCLVHITKI